MKNIYIDSYFDNSAKLTPMLFGEYLNQKGTGKLPGTAKLKTHFFALHSPSDLAKEGFLVEKKHKITMEISFSWMSSTDFLDNYEVETYPNFQSKHRAEYFTDGDTGDYFRIEGDELVYEGNCFEEGLVLEACTNDGYSWE